MDTKIYCNKRNHNTFLEACGDKVRQYMEWTSAFQRAIGKQPVKNYTGDGKFHRLNKESLTELLEDYEEMEANHEINEKTRL